MKRILVLLTLGLSFSLTSCKGVLEDFTGIGTHEGEKFGMNQAAVLFVQEVLNGCGESPSLLPTNGMNKTLTCDNGWRLVKGDTWREGWIVVECANAVLCSFPHGPFGSYLEHGKFMAFNLYNVDQNGGWYKPGQNIYDCELEGVYVELIGMIAGSNQYMDAAGNIYSEAGESKKDLEAIGANVEKMEAKELANVLSTSFGMSEDRSFEVAKLTKAYQKIASKRSLTEMEKNHFSSDLLGVNYNDALNAFKNKLQGNGASYEDMIEKAAAKNGTSPEAISMVVEGLLNQ